jgi:hypothetical protein
MSYWAQILMKMQTAKYQTFRLIHQLNSQSKVKDIPLEIC